MAPRATVLPACDPPPRASAPVGGGGEQKKKLRKLERIAEMKESLKSHKKATPIHREDAPNAFDIAGLKATQIVNATKKSGTMP